MATYLDKFCKDLATLTRPLRDILKKDAAWCWDEQQVKAMTTLKTVLSSLPVLRLFDVSKPVLLSVDASPVGLGAVLVQDGQPVAFSSTTFTATQRRYCQIEKELLAIQFGLLRFRQYVYGQRDSGVGPQAVSGPPGQADRCLFAKDPEDAAPTPTV
jgi:hypothetical protein